MEIDSLVNYLFNLDGNHYYDSGCTVYAKNKIKNVILTLDVDSGTIFFAKTHHYDTIIVHHAVGKQYYQSSEEIFRRAKYLFNKSILSQDQYSPESDSQNITEKMWSANKISMCSLAEQMGINIISCHSIADELIAKEIDKVLNSTKSIDTLITKLHSILQTKDFYAKYGIAPHIYGKSSGKFQMGYCDISYAVPPSDYIIKSIIDHGYDLLILTAASQEILQYAQDKGVVIICINHLQMDICAMRSLSNIIHEFDSTLKILPIW